MAHDLASWNDLLRRACGQFDASLSPQQPPFVGSIEHRDIDGLELTRIRTNAGQIRCRKAASRTGLGQIDSRHCFLVLQRQGHSLLRQNDATLQLLPGDMALLDTARGCEIIPQGLMEHASVHLSRDLLARHLQGDMDQPGPIWRFGASSRLMRLLVEQIASDDLGHGVGAGDGAAMQEALVCLLVQSMRQARNAGAETSATLADSVAGTLAPASRARIEGGQLALARSLINQSLSDPLLSPARIAARTGVSVRQLYRLFEESGDSIARYIQRARLQRAAVELRGSLAAARSITDIAFGCGFNDAAHFSRAFRKQFGLSPREYRCGEQAGYLN
ncbi:MAG: transcriptional regulator FeaR [Comamonas sp.]